MQAIRSVCDRVGQWLAQAMTVVDISLGPMRVTAASGAPVQAKGSGVTQPKIFSPESGPIAPNRPFRSRDKTSR